MPKLGNWRNREEALQKGKVRRTDWIDAFNFGKKERQKMNVFCLSLMF
jgi:hypothetical protein